MSKSEREGFQSDQDHAAFRGWQKWDVIVQRFDRPDGPILKWKRFEGVPDLHGNLVPFDERGYARLELYDDGVRALRAKCSDDPEGDDAKAANAMRLASEELQQEIDEAIERERLDAADVASREKIRRKVIDSTIVSPVAVHNRLYGRAPIKHMPVADPEASSRLAEAERRASLKIYRSVQATPIELVRSSRTEATRELAAEIRPPAQQQEIERAIALGIEKGMEAIAASLKPRKAAS